MGDIATRIRDYYESAGEPVSVDEVTTRKTSEDRQSPTGSTSPIHGWVYALGAAAAVLVLLGGAALLFRTTGSDPLSSATWSRVPHDEAVFGGPFEQSMWSVTAGGPGLVAVGGAGSNAAVWTSADGITWSRVPHNEAVFGGRASKTMWSVTVGGPGLVAVGDSGPHNDLSAAVWTSLDGITWSRVPHNEEVFGGGSMSSVAVGGPGLVAVGFDGDPETAIHNAVVWTSPDGITWSRVPHNEAIFGGETGVWMSSVTAGGPGLVAVGSDAAVWTSADGITWSRVPHNEAVFGDAGMSSVIAAGPGLVAVGGDGSDAAVWTSADGITWSRVPHDEAIFGGEAGAGMSNVTVGGPGLVAVGGSSFGQDDGRATAWTSPDGITWSRVPHDEAIFGGRPDVSMSSVTSGGPGLVAVGESGFEGDFDAAVWVLEED